MAIFYFPQYEGEPFGVYFARLEEYLSICGESFITCDILGVIYEGLNEHTWTYIESKVIGGFCSLPEDIAWSFLVDLARYDDPFTSDETCTNSYGSNEGFTTFHNDYEDFYGSYLPSSYSFCSICHSYDHESDFCPHLDDLSRGIEKVVCGVKQFVDRRIVEANETYRNKDMSSYTVDDTHSSLPLCDPSYIVDDFASFPSDDSCDLGESSEIIDNLETTLENDKFEDNIDEFKDGEDMEHTMEDTTLIEDIEFVPMNVEDVEPSAVDTTWSPSFSFTLEIPSPLCWYELPMSPLEFLPLQPDPILACEHDALVEVHELSELDKLEVDDLAIVEVLGDYKGFCVDTYYKNHLASSPRIAAYMQFIPSSFNYSMAFDRFKRALIFTLFISALSVTYYTLFSSFADEYDKLLRALTCYDRRECAD